MQQNSWGKVVNKQPKKQINDCINYKLAWQIHKYWKSVCALGH